jgi:hypothetical protein
MRAHGRDRRVIGEAGARRFRVGLRHCVVADDLEDQIATLG